MSRITRLFPVAVLLCAVTSPGMPPVSVARVQSVDPQVSLESVLSGLAAPVLLTNARDGSGRLFVVEKGGRILVLQQGSTTPTTFLNITQRVRSQESERGLLGLAFHPGFSSNGRFFVNYTREPDGATVVAEYRVSASNPDVADTQEDVFLVIPQPFSTHNAGMIEFGPDEYLYIATGDGGSANDPQNRAQNIEDLLGKILRIDVDRPDGGRLYSSPPDNPFFGATPGRDEIFAYGLRNPFRFSFDRGSGLLFAGDVGQDVMEEIDIIERGGNYGWRVFEGTRCTGLGPASCTAGGFIPPIAEYSHSGGRCSITGGYVYRGSKAALPLGAYIFGDFCTGEIMMLAEGLLTVVLDTNLNISSFGEDESGELYVVNLGGSVHRIVDPTAPPPPPVEPLRLDSAEIRNRNNGRILDPITTKRNGKKFDIIVRGAGFPADAVLLVGGRTMKKQTSPAPDVLMAKLRKETLQLPGPIPVQVVSAARASNILILQIENR